MLKRVVRRNHSGDALSGFSEAIAACYPKTEIQKCMIHHIRNSTPYVSFKDLKKVTADLKPIHKAATEGGALLELDRFEEVWGAKYPLIVRSWRNNWEELSTLLYPRSANSSTPPTLKATTGSFSK
ncbi:transposase [Paenibacillus sp. MER 180]|uniref:transposase n=1 Tax=Paenibacillus sp. KS1 TaxID=1849249 RepID=UPI00203A64DC|nr:MULTISPECIES: transposase [unclassified Paenibacillus]MCM3291605.1 transposase [Paenibacillus sp. MER 180]